MIDLEVRDIDYFLTFEWGHTRVSWFECVLLGVRALSMSCQWYGTLE